MVATFLLSMLASFVSYATAVETIKTRLDSIEGKHVMQVEYMNAQLQDIRTQLQMIQQHLINKH